MIAVEVALTVVALTTTATKRFEVMIIGHAAPLLIERSSFLIVTDVVEVRVRLRIATATGASLVDGVALWTERTGDRDALLQAAVKGLLPLCCLCL